MLNLAVKEKRLLVNPCGEAAGTRTQDPRLKRPLLYRLSYRPKGLTQFINPLGFAHVGCGRSLHESSRRTLKQRWPFSIASRMNSL